MVLKFADSTTPLTCNDLNENFKHCLERSNHNGFQSASTINDLETTINSFSFIEDLNIELENLRQDLRDLQTNLFGNGTLSQLIADLQTQIDNLINNLNNAVSSLDVIEALQNATDKNSSAVAILNPLVADLNTTVGQLQRQLDLIDSMSGSLEGYPAITSLALGKIPQILKITSSGVQWQNSEIIEDVEFSIPTDFATITDCINYFQGKTLKNVLVNLPASTIEEQILIEAIESVGSTTGLTFMGSNIGTTTIKGSIDVVNCNIGFKDLIIEGNTPNAVTGPNLDITINGILLRNQGALFVENCQIKDCDRAIVTKDQSRAFVTRCILQNNTFTAVYADENSYIALENSEVKNSGFNVFADGGSTITAKSCSSNNGEHGFVSWSNSTINLYNCNSSGNNDSGVLVKNNGSAFLENVVCTSNNTGVKILYCGSLLAIDSVASRNFSSGFVVSHNSAAEIINGVADNNSRSGFEASIMSSISTENATSTSNNEGFSASISSVIFATGSTVETNSTDYNTENGVLTNDNSVIYY